MHQSGAAIGLWGTGTTRPAGAGSLHAPRPRRWCAVVGRQSGRQMRDGLSFKARPQSRDV